MTATHPRHRFTRLAGAACVGALAGASHGAPDAAGATPDEVRAIVAELMADAGDRTSLAGSGVVSAGPDGFTLSDEQGAFRLRVGGYVQFRYVANFRGGRTRPDDDDDDTDVQSGFTIQRARLIFQGRVHDKVDFVVLPFAGPDGSWGVLDAWARFELTEGLTLQVGQSKLPFFREWLISERYILPVERSELSAVYASEYGQGVLLNHTADGFRIGLAFNDGLRTRSTDYDSDAEADYAFTARAEWLLDGSWGQFADASSLGATERGLLVGAAAHHQGRTDDFRGFAVDRITQVTADVSYEQVGFAAMVAGVARWLDLRAGPTEQTFGLLAQAGLFVTDDTELVARYELLVPDTDAVGNDPFNAVTLGVNHYVLGHALKLSFDAVYFIDDTVGTTIVGFGQDNASGLFPTADTGELTLRAQLQFIF